MPILGTTLTATNVTATHGTYRYNSITQSFSPQFTLNTGELYNLTQAAVNVTLPTTFAKAIGVSTFNVSATATAAHRPRDVVLVLDYSGSMNNESDLWNNESYLDNGQSAPNNTNDTSNNSETVYPLFGHYSNEKNYSNYTNYANLLSPSADGSNALTGNAAIGKSNVSISALGVPAMVNDFWSNSRGLGAAAAFTQVADASLDAYNQAGGDKYLHVSNISSNPYATNVYDVTGSTTKNAGFETNGYKNFTGAVSTGYIQGPRYWGKTFFVWPPDPKNDWRQLYFGTTDNTKLWDASGNWLQPGATTYTINYKAILAWIKSAPNPFPSVLRSGNVVFYTSIPTDVQISAYDITQPNSAITDPSQRFWKSYIDFVIGDWRDSANFFSPFAFNQFGADYTFGTVQITAPPGGGQYMNYQDNPRRPRHRLWFGPMMMIQFMINEGILPGTAHDIAMYPMKTGIGGALQDIQNNHPNDLVSMILFNRPQFANDAASVGRFNNAQFSLNNNYQTMINALWLPSNSSSADVTPWDTNGMTTPRAIGHNSLSATSSQYGFMLAYNQFSSNPILQALDTGGTVGIGGLGRVGAKRLVIFETDGMANVQSNPTASFQNLGAYNSYYPIQTGQTVNSAAYDQNALLQTVQNICNNTDGTPGTPSGYTPYTPNLGYPGYATPNRPVDVECLAFGVIFEVASTTQTNAVNLLSQISTIGGSVFPASPSDPTNGYKWCTGTLTQRQNKLRSAFATIMNNGVPISLVQ